MDKQMSFFEVNSAYQARFGKRVARFVPCGWWFFELDGRAYALPKNWTKQMICDFLQKGLADDRDILMDSIDQMEEMIMRHDVDY